MDCHIIRKSPKAALLDMVFFVHDTVNLSSLVQMGIVINYNNSVDPNDAYKVKDQNVFVVPIGCLKP